jgi:hypothetical protein
MSSDLSLAPILGRQIKLRAGDKFWCPNPKCHSCIVTIVEGKPPHAARLNCTDCGRFRKWMSAEAVRTLLETTALFGWPASTTLQDLSPEFTVAPSDANATATLAPTPEAASEAESRIPMTTNIAISNDGFAVQEKGGSGSIIGQILKFTDGQFMDKDKPLAIGTRLGAKAVVTAWVHWVDQKPAEHRVTQSNQRHPVREELPDRDVVKWPPGLNGEPNDPWKDTRYLHLIDQQTGADYTFITDNIGGRRGIADLKSAIMNVRNAHPNATPIVALGSVPWKTKYGVRHRPQFNIVEWVGRDEEGAPF